uniref:monocarboxylate transporter 12-B n=1 Tax=Anopheles coluzzii TaxID=1518534 RepID=UPI0020FFC0F7|nr:monocarboxylate transporter 12-B [Anopheles coluzzii]XP_040226152.2 monocarboxylate transporter 12-B [Anopheles coluzzii]XP_049464187.1 monocarboxylate transporter 12-B [Anopheles coluzzii]
MTHGPPASRKRQQQQIDSDIEQSVTEVDPNGLPTPPDGGWGWMVVLASFSIHIITDGLTYSFGIFYSEFLTYFNEGKGYTAWIASILVGVTLCSGPISSSLVNRYGCRAVTIAGALLASASLAVSMYATSVFMLFITIGVGTGLGLGLIYLPAIVSVTMYFERLRSLATGIAVCGSGLGTSIFAPLTEALIKKFQWQGALLAIAGIVLICVLFGLMFRPLVHEPASPGKELQELPQHSSADPSTTMKPTSGNANESNLKRSNSHGHVDAPKIDLNANGHSASGHNLDKHTRTTPGEDAKRLGLSQPLLTAPESVQPVPLKRTESGTMYRKDALYTGSVHNIASRHASQANLSIYEKGSYGSVQGNGLHRPPAEPDAPERCLGCIPCSRETCDTFREMMNFSILKDPIFIIFTVSNFLTSVGFNVPYVYLAAQAQVLGIGSKDASYLLGIIGIANTVGRIVLGYLSDKPWVNRLAVYNCSLAVCGIATALSVLCVDFYWLGVYSAVYGFTIGAYVGLTSVILVDLLGLEKLTNAFGLLLLFQGIASFVGPPIAGWLYDYTLSYGPGFIMAGTTIAISGAMLFAIPSLQRYLARRRSAAGATVAIPLE